MTDRYESCTEFEGRWYSDKDMMRDGRPIDGAVPSPWSRDRTPYRREELSEAMVTWLIVGGFVILGLLLLYSIISPRLNAP